MSLPVSVPIFYPLNVQSDFVRPHIHPIACLLLGVEWSRNRVRYLFITEFTKMHLPFCLALTHAEVSLQFWGRIIKAPGHGEDMKEETRDVELRYGTCYQIWGGFSCAQRIRGVKIKDVNALFTVWGPNRHSVSNLFKKSLHDVSFFLLCPGSRTILAKVSVSCQRCSEACPNGSALQESNLC